MATLIKKVLNGGLNTDLDPSGRPQYPVNDYLDSVNTRYAGRDKEFALRRTTIKGNILRANEHLPQGTNKCIGAFEYRVGYSIIAFIWNSENQHGIYEYMQVPGIWVKLIQSEHLGFKKHCKIHSADMVYDRFLYWVDGREYSNGTVDGSSPKKIDRAKANNYLKNKQFRIYFDTGFITPGEGYTITFDVLNDLGVTAELSTVSFTVGTGTVREEYEALVSALNAAFTLVNFSYVDNYILAELTLVGSGDMNGAALTVIPTFPFVTTFPMRVVEHNCYGEITPDHLERIKYPPLKEPVCQYGYDPAFGRNLIKGKYFQFAVQYVYDNGERSVAGPYSELMYLNPPCGVSENDFTSNYIDVDFTDPRLNDQNIMNVLNRVRVYVREGELRQWKFVTELERHEFGISQNKYRFYNDGNYPLAPDDIYTIQDDIPYIATAQAFVNESGYLAGCLEGDDNIPTDGKVNLTYEAPPCVPQNNGKVTGRIYIKNPFGSSPENGFMPIHDYGEGPCWGGMKTAGGIFSPTVITNYNQKIPLRGWVVYLAGTDYYNISTQNIPSGVTIAAGTGNVYKSETNDQRDAILNAMQNGQVYSTFEISAPPGKYILRIASHLLSETEVGPYKFPGDRYQETSTFVQAFIGSPNQYEALVEITPDGTFSVDINIRDLIDITNLGETSIACGYVLDADGSSEQDDLQNAPRVEGVLVEHNGSGGGSCITDHNGFFYLYQSGVVGLMSKTWEFLVTGNTGSIIKQWTNSFYRGDLNALSTGVLVDEGSSYTYDNLTRNFILYNTNTTTKIKTKIQGRIMNGTSPVPGIKVLCTRTGRVSFTDGGGLYSILIYGPYTTAGRTDRILVNHVSGCCVEYPDGYTKDFTIPAFVLDGNYSANIPFTLDDFLMVISGQANELRWKKRNMVDLYVQYTDHAGRVTRAMPIGKKYIPFPTEDGGSEDKPVISWEINHQPPVNAVKYQILRKKNPYYNRYLQFIILEAKYVKYYDTTVATPVPVLTTYDSGDASEIYLSLLSVVQYGQENSGSIIGYIPESGDRVTIYKDSEGNLMGEYYDFPVENYKGVENSGTDPINLIIKNSNTLPELLEGTLVEMYTPKLRVEDDFAFEFGETYDILEPGTVNRRHAAGFAGVDQVLGTSPATGTLTSGDCYYRTRNMVIQSGGSKTYYQRNIEDQYISDTDASSKLESVGRPNYEDKEYKRDFFKVRVRYDLGFMANGTKIYNGHSSFRATDFIDIDNTFGAITKLLRVGEKTELLAIQRNKIQPLYTKRSPLYSIEGDGAVAKDSSPLTIATPLESDWGTQHPESIIQDGNQIWGVDLYAGVIWYYASGGLIPISDKYGIRKKILEIREAILPFDPDYVYIYSGMDRKFNEILWAFSEVEAITGVSGGIEGGGTGGTGGGTAGGGIGIPGGRIGDIETGPEPQTLSFSLLRNKWETRYTIYPEWMIALGKNDWYAFSGGEAWHQEQNSTANNFFGVQYTSLIKFAINENNSVEQDFLFTRILGNKPWKYTIEVLPTETYPEGQLSRITTNRYDLNAGAWTADFLRDMRDRNFDNDLDALFHGRPLKGYEAIITAETKETKFVHVSEFDIGVILSPETM